MQQNMEFENGQGGFTVTMEMTFIVTGLGILAAGVILGLIVAWISEHEGW